VKARQARQVLAKVSQARPSLAKAKKVKAGEA